MMLSNNTLRLHWIDNLRGLAMFAIFLAHASASWILGFYEPWPYYDRYASQDYLMLLLYLQSLLPPFFFILSGYLAANSLKTEASLAYIGKRLLRLGIPFVIGMSIFIIPSEALYMMSEIFPSSFWQAQQGANSTEIGQHMLAVLHQHSPSSLLAYFDNTQVYWFLYYLLIFECLSPVFNQLIHYGKLFFKRFAAPSIRFRSCYAYLPIAIAVGFSVCFQTPPHLSLATPMGFIPEPVSLGEFAMMYGLGMLFCHKEKLLTHLAPHAGWQIILGILVCFNLFYLGYLSPIVYLNFWYGKLIWLAYNLFLWLTLLGTTAGFSQHYQREIPAIRYLADAAYWIYFIHLPLIIIIQAKLSPLALNPLLKYPFSLLLATLAVLLPYHFFIRPWQRKRLNKSNPMTNL